MVLDKLGAVAPMFVAGVTVVAGWVGRVERTLRRHDDDIDDLERRQEGDDADPGAPGLLEQVDQLERDLEQVDAKLERAREERQAEHATVMDRLDELETEIHDS